MSKEDIINYVMTTPNNPNRAVLSGMLDSIAEAGDGSTEPLIVGFRPQAEVTQGDRQLDKTFGEIWNAYREGRAIYLEDSDEDATQTIYSLGTYSLNGIKIDRYLPMEEQSESFECGVAFYNGGSYSAANLPTLTDLYNAYPYMTY